MSRAALLATAYARRPLLIEPQAAQAILRRLAAVDPRGLATESRFEAFLRNVGLSRGRPAAMDDDEGSGEVEPSRPAAYAPLWAQQAYGEPTDEGFAWCLFQGIATMEVATPLAERGEYYCGTWYHGYDTVLAGMREALADERVKAVFLRMSSPGGPVSGGLPALSSFMRQARAAAGGKPIWIYADMACSAAYWCSAPADRIVGPKFALVGSIGAVLLHEDYSGAMAKAGLVITPIQFGAQKTAGAWWEALSAAARDDLQAEIDQCGRDFVADVAASRPKLTPEALLATEARVFMGQHDDSGRSGLELGFLDEILGEEEAFAALLADITPKSAPQSAAPASGTPAIAAHGSRAAGQQPQEASMATGQAIKGPKSAQTAQPGPSASTAEDKDNMEDAADGGADEAAEGEPAETNKEKPASDESAAIADSPEAKTHPHLALAAIKSGQTLAQFQATVVAVAGAPKVSKLDAALGGSPRLGADGQGQAAAEPKAINAGGYYQARAKAMGQRR